MSQSSGAWAGIRRGGAVDSLSGGSVVFLRSECPRGYQARSSDVREGQGPERAARRPSRRQETPADLTVLSRRSSTGSSRPGTAVPGADAYRSVAPHESCSAATAASTDGLTLAVLHATVVVTTLKFSVKGRTTTVSGAIFFIAAGMRATP